MQEEELLHSLTLGGVGRMVGKPSGCCRETLAPGLSPIASILCQAPGQGGAQASAVTALCAPKNRLALGSVHLGWLSLLAEVAASSSVKPEYNI